MDVQGSQEKHGWKTFHKSLWKVTCATRLFQTGTFDEQTIMSRTGHRSTAVRSYKRPSSSLVKTMSDALQLPSGELELPEGKIKTIEAQDRNEPKSELSPKTSLVIKHFDTSMTLKFE